MFGPLAVKLAFSHQTAQWMTGGITLLFIYPSYACIVQIHLNMVPKRIVCGEMLVLF